MRSPVDDFNSTRAERRGIAAARTPGSDRISPDRMVRSAADRVKPLLAGSRARRPPRPALPRLRSGLRAGRSDPLSRFVRASRGSRGRRLDRRRLRLRPRRNDPRQRRPDPPAARQPACQGARLGRGLRPLRPGGARRLPPPLSLGVRRGGAPLRHRDGARGGGLGSRLLREGVPPGRAGRRTSPHPRRLAPPRPRLPAGDRPPDAAARFPGAVLFPRPRRRVRLQALEPLPALDGPQGRPRLRAVAGDPDEPARDPDGHARSSGRAAARSDEAKGGGLEDRAGDHRPPRAVRPAGSGSVRLRPLPDRRGRDLPAGDRAHPVRRVPARNRVPDRPAPFAWNPARCHPAEPPPFALAVIPSPSPFLSSRAERGIRVSVDSGLQLRTGSARDLCPSRPQPSVQDRVA